MSKQQMNAAEMGAKGGKARAERLTPEERSELARRAVEARWEKAGMGGEPVIAPHNGVIRIPGAADIPPLEIPCSVLADGTRLLSERGVAKALGLLRSGGTYRRSKEASEGGAKLPIFVAQNNLTPFVDLELASVLKKPVWYKPATGLAPGRLHKGMRAELLPRICNVWLKARDAGVIRKSQAVVIANADIITRGLAEVGIVALVDEATGFQDVRAKDALAKYLEKFVAKEIQNYVKLFPLGYYKGLCRLKGVPFVPNLQLPRYFGHLTNNIVYARLAPAVLEELKRKNPVVNGRRKGKHYNWLTHDLGHPKLLQHMGSVVTLMDLAETDWDSFTKMLDRIHPLNKELPLFKDLKDS